MNDRPARLLSPDILRAYERRGETTSIPLKSNLEENVQLRAIIRELFAHIRRLEQLLAEAPIG